MMHRVRRITTYMPHLFIAHEKRYMPLTRELNVYRTRKTRDRKT